MRTCIWGNLFYHCRPGDKLWTGPARGGNYYHHHRYCMPVCCIRVENIPAAVLTESIYPEGYVL